ncbi:MAG: RHS repeat protein, partial [Deltaproteobacteria bacterium]|nr:RHS repeat protein [Deltaproteobacteria bacterium]
EGEEKEKDCEKDPEREECQYEEVKVASKEDQTGATEESPEADSDSPLDPVILYSGEYALKATDLKLRGRGLDFELTRHYRNQWERMGPLGYNWTHNYDEKLILDSQKRDIVHQSPEGQRYWYRWDEKKQRFDSPRGFFTKLTPTEGGFVLKQSEGLNYYFNGEGRMTRIEDAHQNALRFEYGLAGETMVLVRVIDTLGRAVEYRYNDEGLIASVVDPFGREVVYTHDAQKDLVSVRSPVSDQYPQGKTTRYAYSGGLLEPRLNHNLNMIMDPKGQIYLKNVYGAEGLEKDKITAQLFGGKESLQMRVEYEALKASKPTVNTALSRTTVWDRKGVQHSYEHNAWGLRLSERAGENPAEQFEYNQDGLLTKHVYPGGKEEIFTYEGNHLKEYQLKGEDGKSLLGRYGYDKQWNKVAFEERISGTEVRRKEYAYNDAGLLSEAREGGVTTRYEYDPYGRIVKKIEGEKTRTYAYDKANPIVITDSTEGGSRSITIGYDLYGNIQAVTDPAGNRTRYWLNANNLVVQKEDALGHKTHYAYDANDNLAEVTRDVAGALNISDLGYQLRERYNYDVLDNLVKKESQVNREKWVAEEYAYDLNENLTRIKGIDGTAREFVYDPFNRVTEEKAGGETQRKLEYDADGFLIAESDAKGNRKEYQRDSLSRIAKFIDPLGSQLALNYTGLGEIAGYQFKDAKAAILKEVRFAYDALGRKVSEEERLVGSAEGTRDWVKKEFVYAGPFLKEVRDSLGLVQKFGYNSFGEVAAIEDASGNAIQLSYDSRGLMTQRQITKATRSLTERYQYDALGQLISQTDAKGASLKRVYNSLGQLIKEIDPLNQETLYYYDGIGRLLKEVQGERERKLLWNADQMLEAFIDGQGNKVQYTYDNQGRKKAEVGTDGVRREYGYDAAGNLASLTAGAAKYDYTYDALNRLIARASGDYKQTYGYDPLGRLVASTDLNDPADPADDTTARFEYDPLGNLVKETQGERVLSKHFNIRGQKTALFYPSGEEVTQSFDPAGWLENIQVNGQTISQYQYALLGFTQKETLGNGITKNLNYDNLMRLVEENYQKEKNILSKLAYAYDLKGRVILKEDVKQKTWEVFGYNNLDQLEKVGKTEGPRGNKNSWDQAWALAATKREYTYAAEGQWRSIIEKDGKKKEEVTNIASGAGFQYASFNGESLAYDERGNLASLNNKLSFEYDPFNRLTQVKDKATNKLVAKYTYDAHNRRVKKQIFFENVRMGPFAANEAAVSDEAADAGPYIRSIEFVYDNWNLIEEYENGQLGNVYIHGKSLDEPVALKSNGKIFYYHRDRLGSVTGLSDEHGRMAQRYEYTEYGALTARGPEPQPKLRYAAAKASDLAPIAPIDNPLTYTGQYFDAETGLYYYKNRYYAPQLGQFTSKDPLGMVDGPNVYAYVNSDPLNWVDPTGTFIGYHSSGEKVGTLANARAEIDQIVWAYVEQRRIEENKCRTGDYNVKENKNINYSELLEILTTHFDTSNNRFFYTSKGGFMDVKHVVAATQKAYELPWYIPDSAVLVGGMEVERIQSRAGDKSAWGAEDLVSNKAGVRFENKLPDNLAELGATFENFFDKKYGGQGATPSQSDIRKMNQVLNFGYRPLLSPDDKRILTTDDGIKYLSSGDTLIDIINLNEYREGQKNPQPMHPPFESFNL